MAPEEAAVADFEVSGTHFRESKAFLTKAEHGNLAKIFSGEIQAPINKGVIFLDRDAVVFANMLKYLKTGCKFMPQDPDQVELLKLELEYFRIGLKDCPAFPQKPKVPV